MKIKRIPLMVLLTILSLSLSPLVLNLASADEFRHDLSESETVLVPRQADTPPPCDMKTVIERIANERKDKIECKREAIWHPDRSLLPQDPPRAAHPNPGPIPRTGESSCEILRLPSRTVSSTEEFQPSEGIFSRRSGNRAVFGIDEHVRTGNPATRESHPSMASDPYGNLYIAFEDNFVTPQRITTYWSNDGGENWQFYAYIADPDADLKEPNLAIGSGMNTMILVAYIKDNGVDMPVPEVAVSPYHTREFSFHSIPVWSWEGYAKPVIWTDSVGYFHWRAYLTCEGIYEAAVDNINVCVWESDDMCATWDSGTVLCGNLDSEPWLDPDGAYGTTDCRCFITCFNAFDDTLYSIRSGHYTGPWESETAVYTLPEIPFYDVDPEIAAAVDHDNVLICCTKSYDGNDNIGTTWSTDSGATWTYLYSLGGYTTHDEYAATLTANEGGESWHLAFTSQNRCYYSQAPQDYSSGFQLTPDLVDDTGHVSRVYPSKGIASNWDSDCVGICWADFRDGSPDYDIYYDRVDDPMRIYVPEEYPSIQQAISAATTGQSIHVNSGVYVGTVYFQGKSIGVLGTYGAANTTIDGNGNGSAVIFNSGEGYDTWLEGFTVRNGFDQYGGGIHCDGTTPRIRCCWIHDNEAYQHGGGVYCKNSASPGLINNKIYSNTALNSNGGAVYSINSNPLLMNNVIYNNHAGNLGGAVYCHNSPSFILHSTIVDNTADTAGGGICVAGTDAPEIRNGIVWGNSAPNDPQIRVTSGDPEVVYSDIEGGWTGTGECNIDADPLFVDAGGLDYHLTQYSPCVNMATLYSTTNVDIDWKIRPHMGTPEMGAYEYFGVHSLGADAFEMDESEGAQIQLDLDAGPVGASRKYMIFGSVTGTHPGTPLPGGTATLPINFDVFTDLVLSLLNTPVFPNFSGVLSPTGTATAGIDTLGPIPPGSTGLYVSFAYALPYQHPTGWFGSNPVSMEIVP